MSFKAQIGKFSTDTQDKLNRTRRGVLIKLFDAVVLDTPVLSGRLRANWQFTEGDPATGELDLVDPSGAPTVAAIKAGVEASRGDRPVFLTNNLPYAERIEYEGWSSTKAPEGMVRKNVTRFYYILKEATK